MLGTDILIILLLILINGFFVGAEIAFVSVRRTRLDELAEAGDRRAKRAQKLMRDPGRFLAVIQVAITFLGALASAVAAVSIGSRPNSIIIAHQGTVFVGTVGTPGLYSSLILESIVSNHSTELTHNIIGHSGICSNACAR